MVTSFPYPLSPPIFKQIIQLPYLQQVSGIYVRSETPKPLYASSKFCIHGAINTEQPCSGNVSPNHTPNFTQFPSQISSFSTGNCPLFFSHRLTQWQQHLSSVFVASPVAKASNFSPHNVPCIKRRTHHSVCILFLFIRTHNKSNPSRPSVTLSSLLMSQRNYFRLTNDSAPFRENPREN